MKRKNYIENKTNYISKEIKGPQINMKELMVGQAVQRHVEILLTQ